MKNIFQISHNYDDVKFVIWKRKKDNYFYIDLVYISVYISIMHDIDCEWQLKLIGVK